MTHQLPDNNAQAHLLRELEHIQRLLDQADTPGTSQIPTLSDVVTPVPGVAEGPSAEAETSPPETDPAAAAAAPVNEPGPGLEAGADFGTLFPRFSLNVRIAEDSTEPDATDRPDATAPAQVDNLAEDELLTPAGAETAHDKHASIDREQLIDAVIETLMPELCAELRRRLRALDPDELTKMHATTPQEPSAGS